MTIQPIIDATFARRSSRPPTQALLVGLSGIDGCGKGYVAAQLGAALAERGLKAAVINVDGWLNLPGVRYNPDSPAETFYHKALRLDEMFARLILPLRQSRGIRLTMDLVEETATQSREHLVEFADVDAIVLEGAYVFKRPYRGHFDLAVWIDCSFETALERAIQRAQEGLPPEETVKAYRTIYFPAEEIHFARDDPRGAADLIVPNDPRLGERKPAGARTSGGGTGTITARSP